MQHKKVAKAITGSIKFEEEEEIKKNMTILYK